MKKKLALLLLPLGILGLGASAIWFCCGSTYPHPPGATTLWLAQHLEHLGLGTDWSQDILRRQRLCEYMEALSRRDYLTPNYLHDEPASPAPVRWHDSPPVLISNEMR